MLITSFKVASIESMVKALDEISGATSDAVQIMKELRNPAVKESLQQAKEMVASVKDIMEILRDPAVVQNIENASHIADSLKEASVNLRILATDLDSSKVVQEITSAARAIKIGADALSTKEGGDTVLAVREMIVSIKMLVDEVTAILSSSNKSVGVISTVRDTIAHSVKTYQNLSE